MCVIVYVSVCVWLCFCLLWFCGVVFVLCVCFVVCVLLCVSCFFVVFFVFVSVLCFFFFFQAEDVIRDRSPSRGIEDVYKNQVRTYVRTYIRMHARM